MKLLTVGLLGLLLATGANAAELNLSWTNASQNMDGSTIPATGANSLETTELVWGNCGAGNVPTGTVTTVIRSTTVPGRAESTTITVNPGTWCVHARHKNVANVYSPYSAPVTKTVLDSPATPGAPQMLTVTEMTAFTLIKQDNRFVLLPVGTVPGGTACDSTQYVNGHYVVPTSAVTWSGTVRPVVVVAKCG